MNFLLDTHAFIWMLAEPEKLSLKVKEILEDNKKILYLSAASVWEISIKESIGKLDIESLDISSALLEFNIKELPVKIVHATAVKELKQIHKDPFDRMLAAQSISEDIPLISKDKIFEKYKVDRLW